jgi:hypothetical protein
VILPYLDASRVAAEGFLWEARAMRHVNWNLDRETLEFRTRSPDAELMLPLVSGGRSFGSVSHRKASLNGSRLQQAYKNHRARAEEPRESKELVGFCIPEKFGLLDKKRQRIIPPRHLDAVGVCYWLTSYRLHARPPR